MLSEIYIELSSSGDSVTLSNGRFRNVLELIWDSVIAEKWYLFHKVVKVKSISVLRRLKALNGTVCRNCKLAIMCLLYRPKVGKCT